MLKNIKLKGEIRCIKIRKINFILHKIENLIEMFSEFILINQRKMCCTKELKYRKLRSSKDAENFSASNLQTSSLFISSLRFCSVFSFTSKVSSSSKTFPNKNNEIYVMDFKISIIRTSIYE